MSILNEAVSGPAISMTYVSNKALKINLKTEIYASRIFFENAAKSAELEAKDEREYRKYEAQWNKHIDY